MTNIKTYILSKCFRKVIFVAVYVVIIYSLTLVSRQTDLKSPLLNGQKVGWPSIENTCDNEIIGFLKQDANVFYTLTLVQLLEYLRWPNQTACERVGYYGGNIQNFRNQSLVDGQKAICLDIGVAPQQNNCVVYSIGINNEWTFDEAMETYGCQVYSFDPTMDKEEYNRTSKIHFYPIGLGARNEILELGKGRQINSMNLNSSLTSFKLMTLSSIYQTLSPMHGENAVIDYLKIDIEMEEWNVIPELIESGILNKVRQLGMEIHLTVHGDQSLTEFQKEAKILHSLEDEGGMVRFDSKINGFAVTAFKDLGNTPGYFGFEIAWYNKKYFH